MEETTAIGFTVEQMFSQLQNQISTMGSMLQAQNKELTQKNISLESKVKQLTTEIAEFRTGIEMRSENVDAIKRKKKEAVLSAIDIDGVEYVPNYRKYFGNQERFIRENSKARRRLEATPDIYFDEIMRVCERWVDERDMDGGD